MLLSAAACHTSGCCAKHDLCMWLVGNTALWGCGEAPRSGKWCSGCGFGCACVTLLSFDEHEGKDNCQYPGIMVIIRKYEGDLFSAKSSDHWYA